MKEPSKEEQALATELSSCMLSHYKYCAAGVLVGIPLSVRKKSYWPVAIAAAAGTAADFKEGSANCRQQREALIACIARRNAEEAAKAQQTPPAGTLDDFMHNPPPEAWEADVQQGRPEKGWEQAFDVSSSGDQASEREGKNKW